MSFFTNAAAQTSTRTVEAYVQYIWVNPLVVAIVGLMAYGVPSAQAVSVDSAEAASSNIITSENASFDLDMLKSRGLDPKVAEFFSKKARFPPGKRRIVLLVNGNTRGSIEVNFDAEGLLCFNVALLDQANLMIPDSHYKRMANKASSDTDCYDFVAAFPQTEIELIPSRGEVSLVVSTDALRPLSDDLGIYQNGGVGALLNYEVLSQNTRTYGGKNNYHSANTEIGFNAGDWVVRSRQSFVMQNENQNFQSLYTYGQKTFVPYKSTLQIGQINIRNTVFSGAAVTGLQIVPDAALQSKDLGGATVEGIAQSQARVEIRQAGALIHTSLVPAGPFKLPNVQVLNGFTDLDVRVIEASGEQRSFIVPAASLAKVSLSAPGYSFAVGQVRTFENREMASPMVVTGSGGWLLSPTNKLSSGLMLSSNDYQAMAWTLDSSLASSTSISVRNTVTRSGNEKVTGAQASVNLNTSLSKRVSAGVNLTRQTEGFRDLLDTTQTREAGYTKGLNQQQYGVSLGWNHDSLGSLSAAYSGSTSFDGRSTRRVNAAWSKSFQHATVSFNVERSLGGSSYDDSYLNSSRNRRSDEGTAMYLSASVPLGGNRSVRSYANKRNGNTRFGATLNDNSSDFATYSINTGRDTQSKEQDFSGNVSFIQRYTQVDVGYSRSGSDSTTYTGQIRGGVAVHDEGVTLSPYQLTDTFGVAKVGNVSGVKLKTPSGPVWTDPLGNAVIPQLNAYQNTRVEIETKSLPRNVDIQNGFKTVSAGRGSVSKLDFPVVMSRRALLQIIDDNGVAMIKGSSVLDSKGEFVTAVVNDGKVFLSNGQLNEALTIIQGDGKSCMIHYQLPEEQDLKVYFETAIATCKPN